MASLSMLPIVATMIVLTVLVLKALLGGKSAQVERDLLLVAEGRGRWEQMPHSSSSGVATVSSLSILLSPAKHIAPLQVIKLNRHVGVRQVVSLNLRRLFIHLKGAPVCPWLAILAVVLLAIKLLIVLLSCAKRDDWAIFVAALGAVFIVVARWGDHDGLVANIVAARGMDRLIHKVLQAARLLQIACILRIDYLKQDLLHVSLVGLVLNDLRELYAVNFSCNEALHFVEKALLLGQNRLQSCSDLRGHQSMVHVFEALL